MSVLHPDKQWWTASEIAEAVLPDLPTSVSAVDRLIKRQRWRESLQYARRKSGSTGGGGWEYSWELFPVAARRKLLKEASLILPAEQPAKPALADLHAYYESLPDSVKAKAQHRYKLLLSVLGMERSGLTRFVAVDQVAHSEGVSDRTIWNWFSMVGHADRGDWLYYLAPRNRAAKRNDPKATCSPEFIERLKTLFLRLEAPTFAQCYRDAVRLAKAHGWTPLPERTARRRLNEDVPRVVQIYAREGVTGLERCFPPLIRDRSQMHAMFAVNADCHKFDVFVIWPGENKPTRVQIIAFQDLYSGKILSWCLDHTPNEVAVMSAFGEMVEAFGIPEHCTFDNGREFAAKWLTGGAKTRYRGKIRDDDPMGVLPLLGIQLHWARPGHGQAKPIERAFRDLASDIAKDIRFAGAYVGNRPDAKPENYGSKAIPIEEFKQVVAERIQEHNARLGRRSDIALGRSFDEVFAESYERSAIRRASDEQKRLWLMGQRKVTTQKGSGRLKVLGSYYWSDWMSELAGRKVVARFDIEDLHAGVYVYELTGEFLGFAPCIQAVGFYDLTSAKDSARKKSAFMRAQKRMLEKERALDPRQVAAELNETTPPDPVPLENKIVAMPKGDARPAAARVTRPEYQDRMTPEEEAKVIEFQKRFYEDQARKEAAAKEELPIDRFERAVDLERRLDAGERVGEAEVKWLNRYQTSSEYRGFCRSHEKFGDRMFLR